MNLPETVAAIDLGSNSFHMVIARVVGDDLQLVDRHKETIRLAAGLDADGRLSDAAQEQALTCLERLAQPLRWMDHRHVRAVGTNTLRQLRDGGRFVELASEALGHPVEVIAGREEARLIYLGVAHTVAADRGRRLVVDIGGGSTECIIGEGYEPQLADSLYMGHVTWTQRFFPDGIVDEARMDQAELAARQELQPLVRRYRELGWDVCFGSSGTILSVEEILRATGAWEGGITGRGLAGLRKALVKARQADKLGLPELKPSRAQTLAGGLAILQAVIHSLGIKAMRTSSGALREGVLFDLLGRMRDKDVRDATVERMSERFQVDRAQARRVEALALQLWRALAPAWGTPVEDGERMVAWAARLHEVGMAVAFPGYHKHGAYLLANAEMPGFSKDEQEVLAALVMGHRRGLSRSGWRGPGTTALGPALDMCVALRLAVLLNRARSPRPAPPPAVEAAPGRIGLRFPDGWLIQHPLSLADLREEAQQLAKIGVVLEVA